MNVDLLETYKIGNYEKAAVFIGYEHLHRLITKQEKCAGTPIDDFNTPPAPSPEGSFEYLFLVDKICVTLPLWRGGRGCVTIPQGCVKCHAKMYLPWPVIFNIVHYHRQDLIDIRHYLIILETQDGYSLFIQISSLLFVLAYGLLEMMRETV